jgi:23S rRNA (adenine2503-C2)-methyltransferase
MKIIAKTGWEDIAIVYIAVTGNGELVEFVESLQPPLPREKKWVLTISTLYGCPVGCRFCDAGGYYLGRLPKSEIISQIDYLVKQRFPDRKVPVEKFKIQFARMGEPSFNRSVLEVLECLPELYDAPEFIPSFSTVAPQGTDSFFKRLLEIKKKKYAQRFQFQFSIHTTDEKKRDWLIPVKKWSFEKMAEYGQAFYEKGDRKITLNFALASGLPVDPNVLVRYFTPDRFLIKVTPVNPTYQATRNKISSILPHGKGNEIITSLRAAGYEVISSIGELTENYIGSNCGQYVTTYRKASEFMDDGYTCKLQRC